MEVEHVNSENTTVVTVSSLTGNLGVSIHTPVSSPGVSDSPVVSTISSGTEASDNDVAGQVRRIFRDGGRLDDTRFIEGKGWVNGLDLGTDGSLSDPFEEHVFVLHENIESLSVFVLEGLDSTTTLLALALVLALALGFGVLSPAVLSLDFVINSEVQNIRDAFLVIAVGGVAVEDVLLRQVVKAAVFVSPVGLEKRSRSEDRGDVASHTLVFDVTNKALGNPTPRVSISGS